MSVIIPAYKARAFVLRAVESALAQQRPPLEVIVVDDGSPDDTASLFREARPRVRYAWQENAGVSAARNHGARLARGEWLAFLDADDLWEPAKLSRTLAALVHAPDASWAFTFCSLMGPGGESVPGGIERVCGAFAKAGMAPLELLSGAMERRTAGIDGRRDVPFFHGDLYGSLFFGNIVVPSTAVVRRDFFFRIGGFDEDFRFAEETEFFHRAAASAEAVCVPEPLIRYRTHQSASLTSGSNTPHLVRNALESLERAKRLRPSLNERHAQAYGIGRRTLLAKLAYAELSCLNPAQARRRQLEAWRAGAPFTLRSAAVLLGSVLPRPALRLLHAGKRLGRRLRGSVTSE